MLLLHLMIGQMYLCRGKRIDSQSTQFLSPCLLTGSHISESYKQHLAAACKLIVCIRILVRNLLKNIYTFFQVITCNLPEIYYSLRTFQFCKCHQALHLLGDHSMLMSKIDQPVRLILEKAHYIFQCLIREKLNVNSTHNI